MNQTKSLGKTKIELPLGRNHKPKIFSGDVYSTTVQLKKIYRLPSARSELASKDIAINVVMIEGELDGKPTQWLITTSLPVESIDQCLQVVKHYQKRWSIEEYFKVLKAALKVEDCRLRQADRLKKFLLFSMIIARRLFYIAKISQASPKLNATKVLNRDQVYFLKKLANKKVTTIQDVVVSIACLGGYLNRSADRPPGVLVLTRGWKRFCDAYFLGYSVA